MFEHLSGFADNENDELPLLIEKVDFAFERCNEEALLEKLSGRKSELFLPAAIVAVNEVVVDASQDAFSDTLDYVKDMLIDATQRTGEELPLKYRRFPYIATCLDAAVQAIFDKTKDAARARVRDAVLAVARSAGLEFYNEQMDGDYRNESVYISALLKQCRRIVLFEVLCVLDSVTRAPDLGGSRELWETLVRTGGKLTGDADGGAATPPAVVVQRLLGEALPVRTARLKLEGDIVRLEEALSNIAELNTRS